ncbi:MAG: zf-HC2 domain-containing protein, partial [Actinomycetota bacterium]
MEPTDHPEGLLADAVSGRLAPEERAALDAHLSLCAPCRDELAAARSARLALEGLRAEEVAVPAGVVEPVLREARNALAERVSRPARWAMGLAAAAVVAALAVVAL